MSNVKTVSETHTRKAEYRDGSGRNTHQEITITAVQAPCKCYACCESTEGKHTITWYITKTKYLFIPEEPREEICKNMLVGQIERACEGNVNATISKQASYGEARGGCDEHIQRTLICAMGTAPLF